MDAWCYLLHWRPTLWDDMTPAEQEIIEAHDLYMTELMSQGVLVFAGPVLSPPLAVIVFESADEDAARAVMQADPCVSAGIVPATLSKFFIGYMRGGSPISHRTRPGGEAS